MPGSDSARRGVVRPDRIRGIVAQWPLILVMVAVWCALWQDFAPHVALTGLAFALLIIGLFPMPSIPFSDWSVTVMPAGMLLATSVGMPMPRFT